MRTRGHHRVFRAGGLLAAALLMLLAGCHGGPPPLRFDPGAQVLHLAAADDVPTLDPALGYDTQSWTFEQMIFSTLVRYGDNNVKLEPDIALRWESSPDARTFIFHLRKDGLFSNGRPVTSADFRFGIERVIDPRTRSKGMQFYRGIEGAPDFAEHRSAHVSGIETPDPWTIIFHLSAPDPIFVHKLAMPFAAAVASEAVKRWGEDFSRHPLGSGAFKLREWIGGQRLVLVKNPLYFHPGLPRLDAVVVALGVNEELQWLRFEAGKLDVGRIPPAEFPYVMRTPALRRLTLHRSTLSTMYLGMNCQMSPFTDVRVRRAMNYAINRKKLVALLNGRGVPAKGILPPNLPGYDPHLVGYGYNPERARRLLEQAGVKRGTRIEVWMRADRTALTLGQSIQQDLDLVGIKVVLKPVAWGPFLEAVRQPHTVQAFMHGWEADFPDPRNFLDTLLSRAEWGSNNDSFFEDPELEKLLHEAAPITDLHERFSLYRRAEKVAVADAPWAFLYHPVTWVVVKPRVHGYVINPMRPTRFEKVWLSPHE